MVLVGIDKNTTTSITKQAHAAAQKHFVWLRKRGMNAPSMKEFVSEATLQRVQLQKAAYSKMKEEPMVRN